MKYLAHLCLSVVYGLLIVSAFGWVVYLGKQLSDSVNASEVPPVVPVRCPTTFGSEGVEPGASFWYCPHCKGFHLVKDTIATEG